MVTAASSVVWTDKAQVAILAGQLLLLLIAAIVAAFQASEAKTLREQQLRPFVVIDFDHDGWIFLLTVENKGPLLARDITFKVTPPFVTAHEFALNELSWFTSGIRSLAPGKHLSTLFDSSIERHPDNYTRGGRDPLPDLFEVEVSYTDPSGKRPFRETHVLDLGVYWGLTRIEHKDIDDIHKRLEELVREAKKWASGYGGILTMTPADVQKRIDEHMQRIEERRRRSSDETETS